MKKRGKRAYGVPDTPGRKQLERLMAERRQTDLAADCRLPQQALSGYVHRKTRPGALARRQMEAIGIPFDAWFTVQELREAGMSHLAAS